MMQCLSVSVNVDQVWIFLPNRFTMTQVDRLYLPQQDSKPVFASARDLASDVAYFACSYGVDPDVLKVLIGVFPKSKDVNMKVMV